MQMAKDMRTVTNTSANPFGDLTAVLEQFKIPGVDMSSFVEARRKDVQALVDANKAAYEAMQALAHTQADMLTQAMQGVQESAKGLSAGKVVVPDAAKQAEAGRDAWQKMLADMKTLTEMAHKSQVDAVASLTARAKENMDEFQKMLHPK
jgi:phasin family protein